MKKIVTILAVAALVATSCTGNTETDSANGADSTATTDTAAVIETEETVEADTATTEADTTATSAYAEGSVDKAIEDFLASDESGTKEFTLDALGNLEGEEGSELSEDAELQLSHIADILAANPDLKAEVQSHGKKTPGVKISTTARANWLKAKLVAFKDFKGEQLRAVGHGSDHLLDGVDPKDDAQKRIVIALTK